MKQSAFSGLAAFGVACLVGSSAVAATISPTGDATNVTEQIQAAINNAPNGTVTLATGNYSIIRAITISNGASLVGGGSAPGSVVLSLTSGSMANAIKIDNSESTTVSNLTVTAKSDPYSGIDMNSGLVVDCVIRDIKTKNGLCHGGGIKMSGGTVRGCTITKCEAYNSGGNVGAGEAIYMTGGLVENCVIASNSVSYACNAADTAGGTVYISGGTLRGCLIVDNVAHRNGSGVSAMGGTVECCTIAGNRQFSADSDACGVWVKSSKAVLRNNIIWGNTAFDDSLANARLVTVGDDAFVYNDTKPLIIGTGNISDDPEFIDAPNGDYHTGYSYCSDAGLNQDWMDAAVDLDGNARVRNSFVDMGCYERAAPVGFICRMSLLSDDDPDLANVTMKCGDSLGTASSAAWTFTRQQDGNHVYASGLTTSIQVPTGVWNVRVDISNGSQSDTLEKQGVIVVQSSKVYVNVDGTGEFPYDTVEKGMPSILDALQALGTGGTLYVAAGNYVISNGINLVEGRGARIVSLAGPERTVVRLADSSAFSDDNGEYGLNLACDTAYINGLTFVAGINGPYYNGDEYKSRGFVKVKADGAVVTNCVFRDLRGRDRKWGCGLEISKGTVVDCLFMHIDSFSSGGAMPQGGGLCIQGGLVDRTRIVECHALDSSSSATGAGGQGDIVGVWGSGVLRNSLVTRCTSEHDTPIYVGGGPGSSTGGHLENCTIVANTNLQAIVKDGFWYAAGVVMNGGSVTNCIAVGNWSVLGNAVSNIYNTAGAVGIGYTLVDDRAGDATFVTAANHNINVQLGTQLFRIPEKGNFTPKNNSPAVDSALALAWMETARDLAGGPRIVDRIPDIGCYEASPQGFSIRLR